VGAVIVVFAVILAVNVGTDPRAELNTSHLVGKPAPDLHLTRYDGTKVTSADVAGKVVLVNFWNTWCLPCRQELPVLQQWYRAHRSDPDVVFLGIPRDESSASAMRDAVRTDHMGWAVRDDGGAESATLDFGTRGQPETYVIAPGGVVAGSLFGPATVDQLDQMVAGARRVG
jgi:cytochrome c biogenesis protein CcmG/thiol:disulfide interchange protein DsbE